jgi:hypothetical protein
MAAGVDEVVEPDASPLLPPEHAATRTTKSRALDQTARRLITE